MSRYTTYTQRDEAAQEEGDAFFLGVNNRLDVEKLPAGFVADAQNMRFRNGTPEPRSGVLKPGWLNKTSFAGLIAQTKIKSNRLVSAPSIGAVNQFFGCGVFKDPSVTGREWVIIAADNQVYRHCSHNTRVALPLPTGIEIRSRVTFTQAFDKLFMFRGRYLAPLVLSDIDTGFEDMVPRWDATKQYVAEDEVAFGPWVEVSSLTSDGGLATITFSGPHGYVDGADLEVRGADQTEYNGRWNITVIDELTVTYQFGGSATPTATGTITVSNMSDYWSAKADANLPGVGDSPETAPTKWARVWTILPNADDALFANNLLLVPTAWTPGDSTYDSTSHYSKKDFVVATDIGDPIHIQFSNELRINQGSDDEIVSLHKYNDDQVIVTKTKSWGIISGLRMGIENVSLDMRKDPWGCCAPNAMVSFGKKIYWPATKLGIISVNITDEGKIQSEELPLSDDIQGYIDRINWTAADTIRLTWWNYALYCAVPLDAARTPNAMLVYDFRTKAWAGMDCGPSICPLEFFQCTYNGVQRLAFVGADGFVSMVEAMAGHDQAGAPDTRYGLSLTPIATSLTSRGYAIGSENIKRWQRVRVVLATAGACYSITLNTGSAASNAIVRKDVRQDRAKVLRPFDAPRFVRSNIKQDFMKQGRADYSVVFPLGGMVLMPGINLSLFQEFTQRISARPKAGRYLQVTLTNSEGRMKIKSITPDAVEGARREGTIN